MYPIYFKDNTCVKCGNIVNTVDINNNSISNNSNKDIRKVICSNCKTEYILQWNSEDIYYPIDKYNIERFKKNFNN